MNFSNLQRQLSEFGGERRVYFAKYMAASDAPPFVNDAWNIMITDDGRFAVGGAERDIFGADETFDTEDEACRYLLRTLTRRTAPVGQTDEELAESKRVTREVNDRINGMYRIK